MAEKPRTDIVTRTDALPALDGLDGPGFARLLKARQREAFLAAGMSDETFQSLIGSQSPEDRASMAARLRKLTTLYAFLAQGMEQGSLDLSVPEELPWNERFEALPDGPLRRLLKEQMVVWGLSGMTLEAYMDNHPHFRSLFRARQV